jgi:hypothetical protein
LPVDRSACRSWCPWPWPRHAGHHTLADDRALELGKHAEHLKHRLAGRRRGVEALLMQIQLDPERVQLGEEGDEVLEATAETINRPGHHHVKSTAGGVTVEPIELRPLSRPMAPLMPLSA